VKLRKARVGRNPNRPSIRAVPPRDVVKFKAGKEMKAQVMKLSQTIPTVKSRPRRATASRRRSRLSVMSGRR